MQGTRRRGELFVGNFSNELHAGNKTQRKNYTNELCAALRGSLHLRFVTDVEGFSSEQQLDTFFCCFLLFSPMPTRLKAVVRSG